MLAANLAADVDAWVRLLALHDIDGLADAEPDTMRFRLYHLPARLADHARRRMAADRADLALGDRVHHLLAAADRTPGHHLTTGRQPRRDTEGTDRTTPGCRGTPAQPQRHAKAPPAITRNKQGEPAGQSCTRDR